MDLAFIVLAAAEVAEEHEKSETSFFLLGGALAAFAVLISAFGFTKPDFPNGSGAGRAVVGVGVVLVAATMWAILYVNS